MSNEELSQLYYLAVEIRWLQNEIESVSAWMAPPQCREGIAELLGLLNQRLDRCQEKYDRGMAYIDSIENEWTKKIFHLRYVKGLNWNQVGMEVCNAGDCCRQIVHRYIKRHGAGAASSKESAK